jgi:hypothetical protein
MTKAQAESIVKQYQEDMECDTFEDALDSMTDCLDLLTADYVLAVEVLSV